MMRNNLLLVLSIFMMYSSAHAISGSANNEDMWVKGYIEATGSGVATLERFKSSGQARLMARRAAIVDAQRNLVSTIEGVRISSGTVVKDMMLESDTIATRVKGLLRGAFVVNDRVDNEGDSFVAEVTMGVCLTGRVDQCIGKPSIAKVVLSNISKQKQEQRQEQRKEQKQVNNSVSESNKEASVSNQEPSDTETKIVLDKNSGSAHTGLVVDLQNVDLEPSLIIRLVTESGKVIYDSLDYADRDIDQYPEVWYENTVMKGIRINAMGDNPLVIRAVDLNVGKNTTDDIIISQKEVDNIMLANEKNDIFKKSLITLVIK